MEKAFSHIIPEKTRKASLYDYAIGLFPGLETRSSLKKAVKRGEVYVDGMPVFSSVRVGAGQKIDWKPGKSAGPVYRMNLDLAFEDDHLLVVNKPAGLVVSGNRFRTLENALPAHAKTSAAEDALENPRPVHRLDSLTSGLVIFAKTRQALLALGEAMMAREIEKTYHTVVIGKTPLSGNIQHPIEGAEALTTYRRLETIPSLISGTLSVLKVVPLTGRTHQIRIHLSREGFPVLGDKLYGKDGFILKKKGLFLCATQLSFNHPVSGEKLEISISPPAKFNRFLEGEKKRWEKYRNSGKNSGQSLKQQGIE